MPQDVQLHWADTIAQKVIEERGTTHVVSTGITPSGEIHIGNMREVVTADAIYRALKELTPHVTFNYISDTFDPLRRVYPFLDPKIYEEEVGRPLSDVPCPCGAHPSYADHFLTPFIESLIALGIELDVLRADRLYKEGAYVETITIALSEKGKIAEILREETGREVPPDWSPFNVICQACRRVTRTKVVGFSIPSHTVDYECECGDRGTVSMIGGGKLTWRVDWPARWKIFGVTVEPFGKDHASKGGSYDTGKRIAREVFHIEPPFPIPYEWLSLKGRGDMSSSKGNVVSIETMLDVVPPEVLRYLILRTGLQRRIEFDPGIPLLNLIDEYDDVESKSRDSRSLELSAISGINPVGVPYRHMVTLVQVAQGDFSRVLQILERTGSLSPEIVENVEGLKKRADHAIQWLEKFAPEEVKFNVQEELPGSVNTLTPLQGNALKQLGEKLQGGMSGEQIHQLIYQLKDEIGISPGEFFKAIYITLLDKTSGPRAGWFISTLDLQFVKKRFLEAANKDE